MLNTPEDIIAAIGVATLAQAVGVGKKRVGDMRPGDKLPASWFDACETLTGQTLPRDAFTFKAVL